MESWDTSIIYKGDVLCHQNSKTEYQLWQTLFIEDDFYYVKSVTYFFNDNNLLVKVDKIPKGVKLNAIL